MLEGQPIKAPARGKEVILGEYGVEFKSSHKMFIKVRGRGIMKQKTWDKHPYCLRKSRTIKVLAF